MPKIEVTEIPAERFRYVRSPNLLFAGQLIDEHLFYAPAHSHQFGEIIYILHGTGDFRINGQTYNVQQGDIVVYNPGVEHEERSTSTNEQFRVFYCGINPIHIEGIPSGNIIPPGMSPVIASGPYSYKIESYLSELLLECHAQGFGYETLCQNLLTSLITLIYRILDARHGLQDTEEKRNISMKTKTFIDQNYTKSLTLDEIAQTFYVSKHYLSHLFKKEFGDSPINYLIRCRIEGAKRLLTETNHTVYRISSLVGYENDKYFSKLFCKVTGQTPGSYRNKARNLKIE